MMKHLDSWWILFLKGIMVGVFFIAIMDNHGNNKFNN